MTVHESGDEGLEVHWLTVAEPNSHDDRERSEPDDEKVANEMHGAGPRIAFRRVVDLTRRRHRREWSGMRVKL